MQGFERRPPAQNSLAGQDGAQPVFIQGAPSVAPAQVETPDFSTAAQAANEITQWAGQHLQIALDTKHQREIMEGQLAYQQGLAERDLQSAGKPWALDAYRQIDAQTIASTLLAASRQEIETADYALDPVAYRKKQGDRAEEALRGQDPYTQRLVREQLAQQYPVLAADHTARHTVWKEGQAFDAGVRGIDVVSRDPTASWKVVEYARGEPGSGTEGLSVERRVEMTVASVEQAFAHDNPMAYASLAGAGLLGDNLDAQQMARVRAAKQQYEARVVNEYDAKRFDQERALLAKVEAGELNPSDAATEWANLWAQWHVDVTSAQVGSIYDAAQTSTRVVQKTAAVNFERARVSGDVAAMAAITEPIMVAVESGGNPNAVSPKGAQGTHQVMPATSADPGFGVRPAQDNSPAEIARVGKDYWRTMIGGKSANSTLTWEAGDLEAAAVAYNAGPGVANKWIAAGRDDSILPTETQDYKRKIVAGLDDWRAPTPQDRLALAEQQLKEVRRRAAFESFERIQPVLQDIDQRYRTGETDQAAWMEERRAAFQQFGVARAEEHVWQERGINDSVFGALQAAQARVANDQQKVALDTAQTQIVDAKTKFEAAVSAPDATPASIQSAVKAFAAQRETILRDNGVPLVQWNNSDAATYMAGKLELAQGQYLTRQREAAQIDRAIATASVADLPAALQSRAFDNKAASIKQRYSEEVAAGRMSSDQANAGLTSELNTFYAQVGKVDPKVAKQATGILRGKLIDTDGTPRPEVLDVLTQYAAVKSMNPRAASTMLDTDARITADAVLSRAGGNLDLLADSVQSIGLDVERAPWVKTGREYIEQPAVQEEISSAVTSFIDAQDIGWFQAMFRGSADLADVTATTPANTSDIRSAETRNRVTDELTHEVSLLQSRNPNLKPHDLVQQASESLQRRLAIVGGDVVVGKPGHDWLAEAFGGRANDYDKDGVLNSVVLNWIKSNDFKMQYGEDYATSATAAEMLPRVVQGGIDIAVGLFGYDFNPGMSLGDVSAMDSYTGVRPFRAYVGGDGKSLVVEMLRPDGNYDPIVVPVKRAGELYMKAQGARY